MGGDSGPYLAYVSLCTSSEQTRARWGLQCTGMAVEPRSCRVGAEATQSSPCPHTEVIRPQEAEPDIADTRPLYHILPQHPPTPHDTTFLLWHPIHCGDRRLIYIFWQGGEGKEAQGASKEEGIDKDIRLPITRRRKKKHDISERHLRWEQKKVFMLTASLIVSLSPGVARWKQEEAMQPANFKPISSHVRTSAFSTAGAFNLATFIKRYVIIWF